MVKFIEIDPDDIPGVRESRRGRVSYPILKGFLETNFFLSKLDRTGMQQSLQALYSSLTAYIRSHDMPIKLFSRGGQIYLMRLDIDEVGNEIENWRQTEIDADKATPINAGEVATRFEEEKGKTTK